MCNVSREQESGHEHQNRGRQSLKPKWLVVEKAVGESSRNKSDCKPESPGKFAPHQITVVATDGAPDYVFRVKNLKRVMRHECCRLALAQRDGHRHTGGTQRRQQAAQQSDPTGKGNTLRHQ